jgi:twinkle protein
MNTFTADDINFAEYEWQTECHAKLRAASSFAEDLADALEPPPEELAPSSFSTKLRNVLRFRKGEVTAWAGYSGHRKSLLTGQVGAELAHQRVPTLIVSLEMAPRVTLARMVRQHQASAKPRDLGRFFNAMKALWLFDHVGRLTPHQALAVCRYFAEHHGGQQVFIDSFMMVCTSEEKLDEQKQMATDLVRLAQDTGLHVHVVAHCRKPASGDESKPPGKHDLRGAAAITDQCHNVITVWANKPKQEAMLDSAPYAPICAEPDALLTVCKQRNGEFEGRLKLWFDPQSMRFLDEQTSEVAPW